MSRINKFTPIVKYVLETNERARCDDFILINEVYKHLWKDINFVYFGQVMENHKAYGLPALATIIRIRRRLQLENKELEASDEVKQQRKQEELDIRAYLKERSE